MASQSVHNDSPIRTDASADHRPVLSSLLFWVSTLLTMWVKLVIHFIVWPMIFVFVMPPWRNHTLIRLVILSCSRRRMWTWIFLAKNSVRLLLVRLPLDLFLVPTRCSSIIRSAFNYWIPRLISFICDRTDFVHPISVLHQIAFREVRRGWIRWKFVVSGGGHPCSSG